jgi:hypothetical protein
MGKRNKGKAAIVLRHGAQSSRSSMNGDGAPGSASSSLTVVPKLQKIQKVTTFSVWDPAAHAFALSTSAQVTAGFNYQISNLGAPTQTLVQEFEAYRIKRIDAVYFPNSWVGSLTAPSQGATVMAAFDPDDSTPIITVAQLAGKQRTVIHSAFEKWELSFHPRPSTALFGNSLFAGYSIAAEAPWVDSDNLSVPHFGFKVAANPSDITAAGGVFYFRYTIDVMMASGV